MSYVLVIIYKLCKNIIRISNICHYGLSKNGLFHVLLANMCTKQGGGEIKLDCFSNIKDMLKRKLLKSIQH